MAQLSDLKVHTKLKLSTLWASTMFLYIYCDYFELYVPGKLEDMLHGEIGLHETAAAAVTQQFLVGTSILMAIPSLMIFLAVVLPARYNRILNIVIGVFYTLLLALLAYSASWYFYKFFAAIESALTALVVWYAWKWPKNESSV